MREMKKSTIFVIIFFIVSFIAWFAIMSADPRPLDNGIRRLPEPREIEVGGMNFTVSWGFLENESLAKDNVSVNIAGHSLSKCEKTLFQNDFLILKIEVCDIGDDFTLDELDDGTYKNKTINGVEGILKNESYTSKVGLFKSTHPRYHFDYIKNGKLVMITCDKMYTIEEIVK